MSFYPANAEVPSSRASDRLHLRPLRATDVKRDYDAVMSSKTSLRVWSHSGWPRDDYSLREDLDDLIHHELDHIAARAFTFTVMDPAEAECLGCVYITPMPPVTLARATDGGPVRARSGAADVRFWVRESSLRENLDRELLTVLADWLESDWSFDRFYFQANEEDRRQVEILKQAGFRAEYVFATRENGGRWLLFGRGGASPSR